MKIDLEKEELANNGIFVASDKEVADFNDLLAKGPYIYGGNPIYFELKPPISKNED